MKSNSCCGMPEGSHRMSCSNGPQTRREERKEPRKTEGKRVDLPPNYKKRGR